MILLITQWNGSDLPTSDNQLLCDDQMGQTYGILYHLHQSADENLEVIFTSKC